VAGTSSRSSFHHQRPDVESLRSKGSCPATCSRATREKLELEIGLSLSTREPISYLEIIRTEGRALDLVRRVLEKRQVAEGPVRCQRMVFNSRGDDLPKTYRFAMTGPYYVEMGYQPRISKSAAQFFLDWVYERAKQIKLDDPQQQQEVIRWHRQARDYWKDILSKANAE